MKTVFSLFVLLVMIYSSLADTSGWPQFLGPNRNGAISDETFVKQWIHGELREQWRVPIGEGYSGIVAQGDFMFTMDSNGKDEFVVSLRASDGKEVWRVRIGPSPGDVYGGLGPRVTPTINGQTINTVSAMGDLLALRASSGEILWRRSLTADLGWKPPAEGTACSPLIQDGRIYLMIGGSDRKAVAALDAQTGKMIWTSQEDRASYSSAVRWDFDGVQQALFLTGANLFSLRADTGNLLWKYPWTTYDYVNVATPVVIPPDRVFISSGYDQGAAMLRVRKAKNGSLGVEEVWRNREMKNHFNNSVYHAGTIYGFDNSILKALDADTGRTLWRESGLGKGSLILAGTHLLILSETGELLCAKTSRSGFQAIRKVQAMRGRCWTPPSLAGNRIYLRNQTEIVCFISTLR